MISKAPQYASCGALLQSCMQCLLQYAEFIAALQPQMADDTPAATKPPTTAAGAGGLEHAPEPFSVPENLLMQPQPGGVSATQPTVGFRNTAPVNSGASQTVQAVDALDDHGITVSDGPVADDVS